MNLSERLARAAEDRRRQREAAPRGNEATTVNPTMPTAETENGPLPLWERPLADVRRDQPLATVTPLPIVPRPYDTIDEDLDGAELAQPIPMRGEWVASFVVDPDELHVPPLGAFEAASLAGGALRADHERTPRDPDVDEATHFDDVIDLDDVVDLDDVAVELRNPHGAASTSVEHVCPICGALAKIDIHDPVRGRIHLSCNSCFQMWQARVESTLFVDEPFMRD